MAYKLTHPESNQTIEVDKEMVSVYETQGWEKSPNAKAPKADDK